MKDPKKPTRANNNRSSKTKEQAITRNITIVLVVVLILSLLFLAYTLFGGSGNDDENSFLDNSTESSSVSSQSSEEESSSESESSESSESSEASSSQDSEESSETESDESEDEDEEAVEGEWEPVGTEQTGEHVTNYSEGSQDRIEIKRATSVATGLSENDMIEWWVGNAGDQQVETTVSNKDQTDTYRVVLKWVDGQGWQPLEVEKLSDNPYN